MNVFNKFFLWLVLLPSGFYRKMGIHLPHLRAVLNTKLIMDDRRPSGMQRPRKNKNNKPVRGATIGTMFVSAIMGCVFLFAFSVGKDYLTQLTLYFCFYIFTLTSVLISDFTSVLIDVRDNLIILPKPINDKTFVLARLLHIVIHVSKLVAPMALPGVIAIGIWEGLRGIIPFIFVVASATLFTIFLINAIYIFILKITTPEKFKNIINYFQIFFGIFFYASYQILPRLISKNALLGYSISSVKYIWIAVPYWLAAAWQYLHDLQWNSPLFVYFLLVILLPVASIWVVIKYFAPSFNQKLSMISGSEAGNAPVKKKNGKTILTTTSSYVTKMAEWLTGKGTERMAFLQAWKITSRSRDFKMKVYPSIGYMIVYIVIMFMGNTKLSLADIQNQSSGKGRFFFLGIVYFSSFVLMIAIQRIMYTDKYKAAWIYYITPIQKPGLLLSGAVKATIAKFYLPLLFCISTAAIILIGPSIIPNLLLACLTQLLIITLIAYVQVRALPFSVQDDTKVKGGNFLKGLFSLSIPLLFGTIQFMIYNMLPVIIILLVLAGIASWLMMDALKNKGWEKLQVKEYEN